MPEIGDNCPTVSVACPKTLIAEPGFQGSDSPLEKLVNATATDRANRVILKTDQQSAVAFSQPIQSASI